MNFNKAKQMLLNEVRKLRVKADGRRRDAIKFDAEADAIQAEADKLK